jgi:hypothetical protein
MRTLVVWLGWGNVALAILNLFLGNYWTSSFNAFCAFYAAAAVAGVDK